MSNPQIFKLKLSRCEGRMDPHFYQLGYQQLVEKICAVPYKRLSDLCRFSKEIWDGVSDFDDMFPYLEISDIDLSSGQFSTPKNISVNEAPSRARMKVRHGDILVSLTRPSRGAITRSESEHPKLFIASTGFAVLRDVATQTILADYFLHVLRSRITLVQFEQRSSGGNYPAITEEEMGRVLIPLPTVQTQNRIATVMRDAYVFKEKLEKQANDLLKNIDELLYQHLGLKPLRRDDKVIQKRIFRVPLKLVAGQVFDPKSYHPNSLELLNLLTESHFPRCRLLDLVIHRSAGDWGEDEDKTSEDYTRCLVIRGTEFDNQFNLRIDNSRAKYRQILTSKLKQMRVEVGDLLIEKSGGSVDQPVGRVARIEKSLLDSQPVAYSNFVEKIKVDSLRILPEYLHLYLRFIHSIGVTDLLQSQTNGIRNLMLKRYLALPISLPPKNEQIRLVNDVQAIHTQAQTLRQQAKDLLAQAQQQTEALILGKTQ